MGKGTDSSPFFSWVIWCDQHHRSKVYLMRFSTRPTFLAYLGSCMHWNVYFIIVPFIRATF